MSVGPNAVQGMTRIDLFQRYKLTSVVIKLHRLVVDQRTGFGNEWFADLELVSARVHAPATPLPVLSEATVRIIRDHQATMRAELALYKFDMNEEKVERERVRKEAIDEKVIHDNEIADNEKEVEDARQEALADKLIHHHEMAEARKEKEDDQDAQVESENTLNSNCLLFACMGFVLIWYVQITATLTHMFACLYLRA